MSRTCQICGNEYDENQNRTIYSEAGEWLAAEVWGDAGLLCPLCLENRAKLVMMYYTEYNS